MVAADSDTAAAPTPAAAVPSWDSEAAAAAVEGPVEVLTPLGRLLALLPLEPRLGKLLVMGAALGCLAPTLVSTGWGRLSERGWALSQRSATAVWTAETPVS